MFSNSLKYSIKALTFLATHRGDDKKYGVTELSESINVPAPYLGKVMQKLTKNQIVSSVKGPGGGFFLTPENAKITLDQVVFLFDGKETYVNCILSFDQCDAENPCPFHHIYSPLKTNFLGAMHRKTIEELAFKDAETILPTGS